MNQEEVIELIELDQEEVIELIELDQEEEEVEPIDTFNLPRNYDKDNLDNTTYLRKLKPNTEYLFPDINNYQEVEYEIDNHEPENAGVLCDEVRTYKYREEGDSFEWYMQWGREYNPYVQYHIQGHVHFNIVSVYVHILAYTIKENLEYNLCKTSLSPKPITILQCYNTLAPPQRAIEEIEETRESEFHLGFVPIQRRNTRLFFPPKHNGILKTRINDYPKNFFRTVRSREFNDNRLRQEIEDGKARNTRYKYLLKNWVVGDTTDPPPEILNPIFGRYYHLPVPEIEIPNIIYEYVDHIPKRDYVEYLSKYRELTKRHKKFLDNLETRGARNIEVQVQFYIDNRDSDLVLVQRKNRRQTRTFTEYLQLSQWVR
jgi:hypothetical protein